MDLQCVSLVCGDVVGSRRLRPVRKLQLSVRFRSSAGLHVLLLRTKTFFYWIPAHVDTMVQHVMIR